MRDALFGNIGTIILFRLGSADAAFMEKEFEPEFMTQDMVNLPNHNLYMKLLIDGVTSRPFSATTLAPFKIPETFTQLSALPRNATGKLLKKHLSLSISEIV